MPALTIKNIPDSLYEQLKANAAAHHRSLNGELIATLEQALLSRPLDAEGQLAEIRALRGQLALPVLDPDAIQTAIDTGRP
ncbi:Arc family DNA-binding protein [Thiohalocapsa marina]|uniref:Arc family DNA-binding protein n=1 Tax=Thiohalocapsa marina TaxID=424902 RepID=A0A5M8FSB5_9GAMM|nr:Arc family DNA-binding protein [Thiohalocapsa marina]KAA6186375.1 Arc family DNA-binding protein [Thiohalocapsa marina]